MRWRVSAAPLKETQFQLLGPDGYQTIDFSQSVFAGGLNACGDGQGTCAQYVMRGQYTVPQGARPVQAVHDVYGVLPGGPAAIKTVPETLSAQSFFRSRNTTVQLNVTDTIAQDGPYAFPRPYQRTMWPTTGLCVSDAAPADVSFSPLDATLAFLADTPLTDTGTYCIGMQPVPTDGGDAALVQVRIATLPEVVTSTTTFDPPVERSPVIYQIVLDLEIPVKDRCDATVAAIKKVVGDHLEGSEVHALMPLNLAENATSQCAQTNDRVVPSADMANAVKQLVTTLTGQHQQYHMLYFNNLDAPLPSPLTTSLQSLFDALAVSPPGYELRTFSWMFNPGSAYASPLTWWAFWIWETPDDMFMMSMSDYGLRKLPYTTQWHDANEPVALLTDDQTAQYEGDLVKICTSSPGAHPISSLPFQHIINTPSWTITSSDPPSYLVTLQNQVVVPAGEFVEQSAIVNYQICTRYCVDHPFVAQNGMGDLSWASATDCAAQDP